MGVPVKLVVLDASNDLQTQITQIQSAISAGADVILINPVASDAVVPYLKQAESRGIVVITLDRDTTDPSARLSFIGSNNTALGIIEANALISYLRSSGKSPPWRVVVIEGPPETGVGLLRNNAILSVLQPYVNNGTVQIVSEQNGQFSDSVAFSIMQSVISATGGKIDAVATANALEAEGAARALMSAGIPVGSHGVIITTIDFTPDVAQALMSGQILATAGQAPFMMGYWGVWIAYYHITRGYTPPSVIITPQAIVTAGNITQAIGLLQSPVDLSRYVPGAPSTPSS
jgi:ribose transport system substrate-binding protein